MTPHDKVVKSVDGFVFPKNHLLYARRAAAAAVETSPNRRDDNMIEAQNQLELSSELHKIFTMG